MSSTIIGKQLIYEGDKLFKNKKYAEAINKYLESEKAGYFGEGESRLFFIANSMNNLEIKKENFPDDETIIKLGEFLLYSASDKSRDIGHCILMNSLEEKIPRETKMYMNYLSDLNL